MIEIEKIENSVRATAEIMLFINARRPIMGDEATDESITRVLHSTSEFISQRQGQLTGRGNHRTKFWSVEAVEKFKELTGTARQRGEKKIDGMKVFHNEHETPINVMRTLIKNGTLDTADKLTTYLLQYARQVIILYTQDQNLTANGLRTGKSVEECANRYAVCGINVVEFDPIEFLKGKTNTEGVEFS